MLCCGAATMAAPQDGSTPPSSWLDPLKSNTTQDGVFTSPDDQWLAAAVTLTARTTSVDSAKTTARKAAVKAKSLMLSQAIRNSVDNDPIYTSQPIAVQRTMDSLVQKAAARGNIVGSWIADQRTVGQDNRQRDRVRVLVIAPATGIVASSPSAQEIFDAVAKSAETPRRLGAALLWGELHPTAVTDMRLRLAAALNENGLDKLARAIQDLPVRESAPIAISANPSLADLLHAANAEPWNPQISLSLAQKLVESHYPNSAAIIARCGTRSWTNSAATKACIELSEATHTVEAMPMGTRVLLNSPSLQRPSRARTAIKHGGYVPALIDKSATSAMPKNNLEYAISQYESTPSQATAWALLVALQTDDPAIGRALTRQVETDATLE